MDGGNVPVKMTTIGQLTKQKVHNFVEYCRANLDLPEEACIQLAQLEGMGEVALIAALKSELYPYRNAVGERDAEALPPQFKSLAVQCLHSSTDEQCNMVWRYLELFCDIVDRMHAHHD